MNDTYADIPFLLAQVAWFLVAVAVLVAVLGAAKGFVVWFGGFLIVAELLPPKRAGTRTRTIIRGTVVVGYLVSSVVIYLTIQSWLQLWT